MNICDFCGLDAFIAEALRHLCCGMADQRGEPICFGCSSFRRRWEQGETCPHVTGKARACCTPARRR